MSVEVFSLYFFFFLTVILTLEPTFRHSQAEPEILRVKTVHSQPEVVLWQTGLNYLLAVLLPGIAKRVCLESIIPKLKSPTNSMADIRRHHSRLNLVVKTGNQTEVLRGYAFPHTLLSNRSSSIIRAVRNWKMVEKHMYISKKKQLNKNINI